jgi:type II secretory pathway pseudopilin PulG
MTLIELIIGAMILALAIAGLLKAFLGETAINTHSRAISWAAVDANRVMEHLRQRNSGGTCSAPSVAAPAGFASWDAWLASTAATGGGGKSIQPDPATNELVVISSSGADPIAVTVAVCWRSGGRVLGDCTWSGANLVANPGAGSNPLITESPAMLSTLLSCRR